MEKKVLGLFFMFLILFLLGCTQENLNQTSNIEKQKENKETTTNTNNIEEKLTETIGYIQSKTSDSTWVASKPNDKANGIVFDLTDIDEKVVSKLKVGQKVKVTHYQDMQYSDPMQGLAVKIELIEE